MQMVDLLGQYARLQSEIDSAIRAVLDSGQYVKGQEVQNFEQELSQYLGEAHVIACANGTDALQLALMALDLKPGDEVIVPNFTFFATVEVVALLGLKPIFVDVDLDHCTIDCNAVQRAISPRTKAIIPVHLYGQCADMQRLQEIATPLHISIIEDTAQALGAECSINGLSLKAGSIGTMGATSFFPSKNLGCYGDGGALICRDDALAAKLRALANHGMIERYHNDMIGINSRLDELQAAILRVKLRHLDDFNRRRQQAAARYNQLLADLDFLHLPVQNPQSTHIYHQYTIRFESNQLRERARKALQEKGIPSMIYYPIPLHRQRALQHLAPKDSPALANSILLAETVLSLPMHTELAEPDQQKVAQVLRAL